MFDPTDFLVLGKRNFRTYLEEVEAGLADSKQGIGLGVSSGAKDSIHSTV